MSGSDPVLGLGVQFFYFFAADFPFSVLSAGGFSNGWSVLSRSKVEATCTVVDKFFFLGFLFLKFFASPFSVSLITVGGEDCSPVGAVEFLWRRELRVTGISGENR